jgi:adenosine deaminase
MNLSHSLPGRSRRGPCRRACFLLLTLLLIPTTARPDERSTARRFAVARQDEPSLIAFLRTMPKGADLHNHVGGALYSEEGLRQAVLHHLFFNPTTNGFEEQKSAQNVPAARLLEDDRLRYQFLDAATMRGPTNGPAGGHDHFFQTFGIRNSAWRGTPFEDALASVVRRARLQNLQYLELMAEPAGDEMDRVAAAASASDSPEQALARLKPLIDAYVTAARADLDKRDREVAEKVGVAPPLSAADRPITVRYLISAFRLDPDERVFATWAAAFALMKVEPRVVGVNLVAPEDHPLAAERFDSQMRLLDFLWRRFDHPNVTLHAGELSPIIAPLEEMTGHIRGSIEVGHARRIGHGTAVAWEDDVQGLLREMHDQGIAVEVCPTSALTILGLEGERHPFQLYRRAGVPLTLNTDDEGVNRSNMTLEYVRAVRWWHLSYADLKKLARNSIEYSFLPGDSLFERHDYHRPRRPFRRLREHHWSPTPEEAKALAASDKATVQARLERALVEFERQH